MFLCRSTNQVKKVKSACKQSGTSGQSLTRFLYHEATKSFPLPLDGMLVPRRFTPSIKFTGTHLQFCIHWVERGTGSVLPKNSRQCLLPGLKCRLLHPETSILTVRPWCFPADHTNSSVLQKTKLGTAGLTTLITRDLIEVWILYCCFLTLALAQNS